MFRDRRSLAQQCSWIRLHSSYNIVGATHAHCAWFTKTDGLYPSHDALQVPKLLGVVASVCTPLPTRTQQLSTLLSQQCWELLRPFARSLILILRPQASWIATMFLFLKIISFNKSVSYICRERNLNFFLAYKTSQDLLVPELIYSELVCCQFF